MEYPQWFYHRTKDPVMVSFQWQFDDLEDKENWQTLPYPIEDKPKEEPKGPCQECIKLKIALAEQEVVILGLKEELEVARETLMLMTKAEKTNKAHAKG